MADRQGDTYTVLLAAASRRRTADALTLRLCRNFRLRFVRRLKLLCSACIERLRAFDRSTRCPRGVDNGLLCAQCGDRSGVSGQDALLESASFCSFLASCLPFLLLSRPPCFILKRKVLVRFGWSFSKANSAKAAAVLAYRNAADNAWRATWSVNQPA